MVQIILKTYSHPPVQRAGGGRRSACLSWSTKSGWCCGVNRASSASTAQNWERKTGSETETISLMWETAVIVRGAYSCARYKPVVANGGESGDVQHQRGVKRAWLGRLTLRWRRAFVTKHPRPSHPPQLGALPWFLHSNQWTCKFINGLGLQLINSFPNYFE